MTENWFRSSLVDFDLWLIHGGEELLVGQTGSTHVLRRGVVAIFKPDEVWSTQPTGTGHRSLRHSYVHFDLIYTKTGKRIPKRQFEHLPSIVECNDLQVIEAMLSKIIQLNRSCIALPKYWQDPAYQLACSLMHGLLQLILHPASRPTAESTPTATGIHIKRDQCIAVLKHLQSDPKAFASVRQMAKAVNLSSSHFSRFFRQITGLSPQQAINSARVERAKLLLAHSGFGSGKVADECGYQSTYYFYRQFKKHTGETPGRYRKRCQR